MKLRLFFLFFLFPTIVYGLSITGSKTLIYLDFEPNAVQENSFTIVNQEGYVSNYQIYAEQLHGGDFSPYFKVEPDNFENVQPGESRKFNVKLIFPESFDTPGRSEALVKVRVNVPHDAGLRAFPGVAIRYVFFVLYPYKYIKWGLSVPNMNVNETKEISVSLDNLGEPTINSFYADIIIKGPETNETIKTLKTKTEYDIIKRTTRTSSAIFDSRNVKPGDYKAIATLHWDGNTSTKETDFRIGSKDVKILNFTKLFEINAINKFDIEIQSAWNTRIEDIYADVFIIDLETQQTVRSFKSFNTDLDPWKFKLLEAYFDTNGLEKKEYKAIINLRYEGAITTEQGIIRIDEDINAVIVEEIPGKFSFSGLVENIKGFMTAMNLLIMLLVFFVIINIILLTGRFKKKKQPEPIDPAVLEHLKELRKKYNDEYIREMMIKKGWAPEKVNELLKK